MIQKLLKNAFHFKFAYWLWYANILILSILPSNEALKLELKPDSFLRADYLLHLGLFLSLGVLYYFAYIYRKSNFLKKLVLFLFIGLLLAVASEYAQKFNPNRTFNPVDLYYNVAGVLISVLVFVGVKKG